MHERFKRVFVHERFKRVTYGFTPSQIVVALNIAVFTYKYGIRLIAAANIQVCYKNVICECISG